MYEKVALNKTKHTSKETVRRSKRRPATDSTGDAHVSLLGVESKESNESNALAVQLEMRAELEQLTAGSEAPTIQRSKRFKCKQLAAVLDQVLDDDPDSFQNVVEQLSSQGGYLSTVVKSKLRTMAKRSAKSEARSSADTAGYPERGSELPSQPCGASAMEAKRVLKPGLISM
eukprot:s5670_g2.t1